MTSDPVGQAVDLLALLEREGIVTADRARSRRRAIRSSVRNSQGYSPDFQELEHACRIAWRNSDRCIGRRHWRSLIVRDKRQLTSVDDVFTACVEHLDSATNGGRIRSMITVFDGDVRILNSQLLRYAGWRLPSGGHLGDPLNAELTRCVERLGWRPTERGDFTLLPLAISVRSDRPRLFELPDRSVLTVPIRHPDHEAFAQLGLQWHALPAVSDMMLEAGGVSYPVVFNGWYMGTEIGARNLGDVHRYNKLGAVADVLGLSKDRLSSLWKDRALVELNVAVLDSFHRDRVTIVDHHTAALQFMKHLECERDEHRTVTGDWSWLVPPMSGSTTGVFHRTFDRDDSTPRFYRPKPPSGSCPAQF